jgi:phosphate transport system permease protein
MRIANAGRRRWKNRMAMTVMLMMVILCLIPLFSILWQLVSRGAHCVSFAFLTSLPLAEPKGIGNAIAGSLLILCTASAISVPLGLLTGLHLSQAPHTRTAKLSRLMLDVMSGIPAIVVGMFIYALAVRPMGGPSLIAAGASLAMIMLPIFARTTEEALKAIPPTVAEAGLGLGLARRKVMLRILLRSATPAVLTGFFLSLARVGGEAAPLLFTSLGSNSWPHASPKVFTQQIASLPVAIYELVRDPMLVNRELAWGASLVLVAMILAFRLSTNALIRWHYGRQGAR